MSQLLHFSQAGFEKAMQSQGVVVVDFWATWCGPCKMIAPAMEKLADEYAGKAVVGKIDVDQESDLAQQFGVMSIPCVVFLKDGVEKNRLVGAQPYSSYANALDKVLG